MTTENDNGPIMPKTITENDASTVPVWGVKSVNLLFPLTVEGGAKISEITLREPDAEMMEKIEALGIEDETKLKTRQSREIIALLSGVSPDALKRLNLRDLASLGAALGPLLGSGEEEPKP